jgi:dihydrofolate reductase
MGDDRGRLHDWMGAAKTQADADVFDETYATTGAVLVRRRMFDVGVELWGDPPPFGMPVFVLTHEAREPLPRAGDRDVRVWGGASIAQQYLRAGLVDELQLHLVPVLLGEGVRLFGALGNRRIELKRTRTIETAGAIHLRFAVEKGGPK